MLVINCSCSKRWKQLIQSRGRSFIFSTAAPLPIAAEAHAAVIVERKHGVEGQFGVGCKIFCSHWNSHKVQ
ncbi:putative 8-amino-7-oxononanoate synthase [Rosa chinensis]|uniref:Putative 8-amino-7-oxononanoate synthase n=1 Tax=Rosa chinensis TaxID=74649 RepID=A0A2P6SFR7_ROSCH|nr:putative 8-amino-7-oxononanoate synthase [Rosa chinensis]